MIVVQFLNSNLRLISSRLFSSQQQAMFFSPQMAEVSGDSIARCSFSTQNCLGYQNLDLLADCQAIIPDMWLLPGFEVLEEYLPAVPRKTIHTALHLRCTCGCLGKKIYCSTDRMGPLIRGVGISLACHLMQQHRHHATT